MKCYFVVPCPFTSIFILKLSLDDLVLPIAAKTLAGYIFVENE